MIWRPLISILFLVLASASVSSQEIDANSGNRATSGNAGTSSYRVAGIVSSATGRMALINGRGYREGESVGGARILSIGARSVSVRIDSGDITINIGSSADWSPPVRSAARLAQRRSIEQPEPPLQPSADVVSSRAPVDAASHGPVQRGETLSEIAERYLSDGVTRNQLMIAMFDANPGAFRGNINVLRAGAVLSIPNRSAILEQTPATAGLEVARHASDWRDGTPQYARTSDDAGTESYGPVTVGETLSVIASRVAPDGVSMNQMMMALFRANPRAFSGNINVLHAGATLRIPVADDLREQTHETATAEVVRQTSQWRAGAPQQANLATAPVDGGQIPGQILSAVLTAR